MLSRVPNLAGIDPPGMIASSSAWQGEVGAIEGIEHLDLETETNTLFEMESPRDINVRVGVVRTAHRVASRIATESPPTQAPVARTRTHPD